jgi:fatty acid synthase subunit alpha, fungi type
LQLTESFTAEKVKEMLHEINVSCFDEATVHQKIRDGYVKLEHSFATIGIDVPFYSRSLWAGAMPFRACQCTYAIMSWPVLTSFFRPFQKIDADQLDPSMLIGKLTTNLVFKPFDVSQDYAQLIYDQTSSPRLDKMLKK